MNRAGRDKGGDSLQPSESSLVGKASSLVTSDLHLWFTQAVTSKKGGKRGAQEKYWSEGIRDLREWPAWLDEKKQRVAPAQSRLWWPAQVKTESLAGTGHWTKNMGPPEDDKNHPPTKLDPWRIWTTSWEPLQADQNHRYARFLLPEGMVSNDLFYLFM